MTWTDAAPIRRVSLKGQIQDGIRSYIRENALPPGAMLPSEAEFGAMFGVGRNSIRAACSPPWRPGRC